MIKGAGGWGTVCGGEAGREWGAGGLWSVIYARVKGAGFCAQ